MNITSIRIIKIRLNLEIGIGAMTALDDIISQNISESNQVSGDSDYGAIINHLFNQTLNEAGTESQRSGHPYLYDTFKCFRLHKTEISIRIHDMYHYVKDNKLLKVLFDDIVEEEPRKEHDNFDDVQGKQNLMKRDVFKIFENVHTLYIQATKAIGKYVYPFSMLSFLDVIQDTMLKKIEIRVEWNGIFKIHPWLGNASSSSGFSAIMTAYKEKQFEISFEKHKYCPCFLTILRS